MRAENCGEIRIVESDCGVAIGDVRPIRHHGASKMTTALGGGGCAWRAVDAARRRVLLLGIGEGASTAGEQEGGGALLEQRVETAQDELVELLNEE